MIKRKEVPNTSSDDNIDDSRLSLFSMSSDNTIRESSVSTLNSEDVFSSLSSLGEESKRDGNEYDEEIDEETRKLKKIRNNAYRRISSFRFGSSSDSLDKNEGNYSNINNNTITRDNFNRTYGSNRENNEKNRLLKKDLTEKEEKILENFLIFFDDIRKNFCVKMNKKEDLVLNLNVCSYYGNLLITKIRKIQNCEEKIEDNTCNTNTPGEGALNVKKSNSLSNTKREYIFKKNQFSNLKKDAFQELKFFNLLELEHSNIKGIIIKKKKEVVKLKEIFEEERKKLIELVKEEKKNDERILFEKNLISEVRDLTEQTLILKKKIFFEKKRELEKIRKKKKKRKKRKMKLKNRLKYLQNFAD